MAELNLNREADDLFGRKGFREVSAFVAFKVVRNNVCIWHTDNLIGKLYPIEDEREETDRYRGYD